MKTEEMEQILLEVTNGEPAPAGETGERARIRRQLTREVAAIRERGDIVDVPTEIP